MAVWDLAVFNDRLVAAGVSDPMVAELEMHSSWSPLGGGRPDCGYSTRMGTYGGLLFVSACVNAVWNGVQWTSMSPAWLWCFGEHNGELYGSNNGQLNRWNGSAWQPVPGWENNGNVYAVASFHGDFYAAGFFGIIGGVFVRNIARFDGVSWHPLGAGIAGGGTTSVVVEALFVHDDVLYVGGRFDSAGPLVTSGIAGWTGSSWISLGSGISGSDRTVHTMATYGGDLCVGGVFTTMNGLTVNNAARWNGTCWRSFGSGVNSWVNGMAVWGDALYLGGFFSQAGGVSAGHVACWRDAVTAVPTPSDRSRPLHVAVFPNPTRRATAILLQLPRSGDARVRIFGLSGVLVRTLHEGVLPSGRTEVAWDGRDAIGRPVAGGVYLVRLDQDGKTATQRVTLLR
jgi:flagellar hook capping protein FlgD